ncbi:DUF2341 domain-containing protein, partial [bacterium]|nr:DUF2341 domain-containing protein [bacterium]
VWVKIPSIPGGSTKDIIMYYGNPDVGSASNPDNTFDVYHNFTSGDLGPLNNVTSSGAVAQSDGSVAWVNTTETTQYAVIQTDNTVPENFSAIIKWNQISQDSGGGDFNYAELDTAYPSTGWTTADSDPHVGCKFAVRGDPTWNGYIWLMCWDTSGQTYFWDFDTDSWTTSATGYAGSFGTWYYFEHRRNQTHLIMRLYDSDKNLIEEAARARSDTRNGNDLFYIAWGDTASDYKYGELETDDFIVRKFVTPEPTYSIGSEESANEPPSVDTPETYDENYEKKDVFYDGDKIIIRVNVTDAQGAEDIDKVLIEIIDNSSTVQVSNETMVNVSSIANGYTYEYNYTIPSGATTGIWTVNVYANDTQNTWNSNTTTFEVTEWHWWNSAWTRRRNITIDNTQNSNTLTNYPVLIRVPYDSDMQTDFDDLRFVDSDDSTELSYWVESYGDVISGISPSITGSYTDSTYMDTSLGLYINESEGIAYTTAFNSNSLNILNISDVTNPTRISSIQHSTYLAGAHDVWVKEDTYAYVVTGGGTNNYFTVVNVSDKENPTIITQISDTVLTDSRKIVCDDNYCYVTACDADSFVIVNITNRTNPEIVGSITDSTYLDCADGVYLDGNYCYVIAYNSDTFSVINVTNKTSPQIIGHVTDNTQLDGVMGGIDCSNNICYVSVMIGNRITSINVTDKTNPSIISSLQDNTYLDGSGGLDCDFSRNVCFVSGYEADYFNVVNITDPSNMNIVSSITDTTLDGLAEFWIFNDGNYTAVTTEFNDSLTIVNTTSDSYADVWVKIPSIPGGSTKDIIMYYGNPDVGSASNPDNTFTIYGNFDDGVFDSDLNYYT